MQFSFQLNAKLMVTTDAEEVKSVAGRYQLSNRVVLGVYSGHK